MNQANNTADTPLTFTTCMQIAQSVKQHTSSQTVASMIQKRFKALYIFDGDYACASTYAFYIRMTQSLFHLCIDLFAFWQPNAIQ